MPLNPNPSQQSLQQCAARMFDSENDAQRVVLVGGEGITLNADVKMPETIEKQVIVKEVQIVEIPVITREVQVVEVPVVTKEVQIVEVPVIVKEVEIREVVREVIVKEIQVVTVEKPIVTTVYETIQVPVVIEKTLPAEFPVSAKIILAVQIGCAVLQLVSHFLK